MIISSLAQLKSFLAECGNTISFDTETTGLKHYTNRLVGISLDSGVTSCYIPLGHTLPEDVEKNLSTTEVINVLNDFLSEKKHLIAYNIIFDAKILYKYGLNIKNHQWSDVMVMAHLLDENRKSKRLKHLVNEEFGDDYGIDVTDSAKVPVDKMAEYACKDSQYTYRLWKTYRPLIEEQGLAVLFDKIEMPGLRAIMEMEVNGVRVDVDKVNHISEELEKATINMEEEMLHMLREPYELQVDLYGSVIGVKGKYNFRSSKDLVDILTNRLGLTWDVKTETGALSIGKAAVESLKGKHPLIDVLVKYKIAQKLLSAFFEPMPEFIDGDGRVRAHFNDIGTATGRLSSSKPNLQQQPKSKKEFPIETRGCFVASTGYKMIAADFSGQELRVLAHLSGDEGMISAFNEGRDFHQEAADNMGVSRDKGKIFNFSLMYGKGSSGLSRDWGISTEEAEQIIQKHFEKYPGVKKAIDDCHEQLRQQGYVTNLLGRRRRFAPTHVWDNKPQYSFKAYRQAFNFLIQGTSADMMRIAMIKVLNLRAKNPSWDMRLLMTVHDELVVEVKERYAEAASSAIKEAFENSMKLKVKLEADVKIGLDYSQVK